MNRIGIMIITVFILGLIASTMVYTVDQRKIAVIYAFGEVKEIINAPAASSTADASADVSGAGLHFKLPPPFQTVRYIDRRIQTLDNANPNEVYTRGTNMGLVVDWFVKWRVVDAKQFVRANAGTDVRTAEARLALNVRRIFDVEVASRSEVQAVLDEDRQEIMKAVIDGLETTAKELGVTIVDVRMRRVDYSASTAPMIFEQMITERKSVAEKLRAEGNASKETIRAKADHLYNVEVANAYGRAQEIMGQGDAEVTSLFAQAFGKDLDFADFYRSLQAYRGSFNTKSDVMILDPESDFFKFMQSSEQKPARSALP